MRIKQLETLVGGLSNPSKMPGLSYGTPAAACGIGAILRGRKGTVCEKCYAHKGMYSFPVVKNAQENRLEILSSNLEEWTVNMTELLSRKYAKKTAPDNVFRWHDSGDVQSIEHLSAIVQIAKNLPGIDFWIPSKEYAIIRQAFRTLEIPSNLIIRVSEPMIGLANLSDFLHTSTVGAGKGFPCEAYTRGGKCGDCRACWDKEIPSIDYPQH